MAQIFVSYSRNDIDRVEPIVRLLENHGWSVWWDTSLVGGDHWPKVIKREIAAAGAVVAVWSKNSIDSEWVYSEASAGKARGILVPVLIDGVQPPMPFEQVQATDLSQWTAQGETTKTSQFISAVHRALGDAVKPPLPGEQLRWNTLKNSTKAEDYKAFLLAFPNGRYADTASLRAQQLALGTGKAAPASRPALPPAWLLLLGLILLAAAYWFVPPKQLVVENTLADAGRVWEHIRDTKDARILEAYEHDFAAFPTYVALAKEKRLALQPEGVNAPPTTAGTGTTTQIGKSQLDPDKTLSSRPVTVPWTFSSGALCPIYSTKSDCEKDIQCVWSGNLFSPADKASCRKKYIPGAALCNASTKALCELQGCDWSDSGLQKCRFKTNIMPVRNCASHISLASCMVAGCKWLPGDSGHGACVEPPAQKQ